MLGDMSFDVDNINSIKDALLDRASKLSASDPLGQKLTQLSERTDTIRKKIVATKEGGSITGEIRIREKATELYGNLVSYEGRPGDYQVARIDSLRRELEDVAKEFDGFLTKDVQPLNPALAKKKLEPIRPLARPGWDKTNAVAELGGTAMGARGPAPPWPK